MKKRNPSRTEVVNSKLEDRSERLQRMVNVVKDREDDALVIGYYNAEAGQLEAAVIGMLDEIPVIVLGLIVGLPEVVQQRILRGLLSERITQELKDGMIVDKKEVRKPHDAFDVLMGMFGVSPKGEA